MATVLKTVVAQVTVGSNPTPSAGNPVLLLQNVFLGEVPEWTIGAAC